MATVIRVDFVERRVVEEGFVIRDDGIRPWLVLDCDPGVDLSGLLDAAAELREAREGMARYYELLAAYRREYGDAG